MRKLKTGVAVGLAAITISCIGGDSKSKNKDVGVEPSIDFQFNYSGYVGPQDYDASFSVRDPDGDLKRFTFDLTTPNSDKNLNLVFEPEKDPEFRDSGPFKNIRVSESVIECGHPYMFGKMPPGRYHVVITAIDGKGHTAKKNYSFEMPK